MSPSMNGSKRRGTGGFRIDFLAPAGDPGLSGPGSVSWRVSANPIALAVGGIAAVILELAEPRIRAGVWDHSTFKTDPIARMERTGLAAMAVTYGPHAAARLTFDRVKADRGAFGALLESFVFAEVLKLMTGSDLRLTPWHFRDGEMREVDIVLERDDGMIVGIQVKASATVRPGDFAGMKVLAQACGDRFAFGVVLYDGADVVPFGDRMAAAPLSCLWR